MQQKKSSNLTSSGNPHPTGEDPYHVSGILGVKNMKGKNRLTSFHIYPDGTVTFSDKKFPVVKDPLAGAAAASSYATSSYSATPATSYANPGYSTTPTASYMNPDYSAYASSNYSAPLATKEYWQWDEKSCKYYHKHENGRIEWEPNGKGKGKGR